MMVACLEFMRVFIVSQENSERECEAQSFTQGFWGGRGTRLVCETCPPGGRKFVVFY